MREHFFQSRSKILLIILNIIGLAAVLMLVLKVPFGYGTTDECYYLLSPLKVLEGDMMLKDEWFVAQLFGFLMLPPLKLFMLIFKSTEGIILAFRYFYVFIKVLAAVFIYRRLRRRFDPLPAFGGTLLFLIYSPFDIMAMSYNTIGNICMTMSAAVIVTMDMKERASAWLTGFLYAAAVLCCPYLAVIYVIYLILFLATRRSKLKDQIGALKTGTWVRITCAAALLAVLFFGFLLTGATLQQILTSLPHILNNPTHEPQNIFRQAREYIGILYLWDTKRLIIYVVLAVICILMCFPKIRRRFRWLAFLLAAALTLCYCLLPGYIYDMSNHFILPISILGFVCFFMTEKKRHLLFWGMWVYGMIYTFAIFLSSNQAFYAISSASIAAAPASIIFICDAVCDIESDFKALAEGKAALKAAGTGIGIIATALLVLQLAVVGGFAWEHCFWDENRSALNVTIKEGCERGLRTSQGYFDSYMSMREETAALRELTDGSVIYYTEMELWLPLDDAKKKASCFSYYFGPDEYRSGELKTYFEMYPEKKPDHFYFEKSTDIALVCDNLGLDLSQVTETPSGNYIIY